MRGSDQRKKVQEQLLENLILLGLKLLHPRSQFLPLSLNGSCVISFSLLHCLLVALQLLLEHLLNHRDNDNHIKWTPYDNSDNERINNLHLLLLMPNIYPNF